MIVWLINLILKVVCYANQTLETTVRLPETGADRAGNPRQRKQNLETVRHQAGG